MGKPSFSSEVVHRKIHSLFQDVSAFASVSGGEESQAFRFTSEGRKLIFRLNSSNAGFAKDQFAFEHFARPTLPIPRVLTIGQFEDQYYCVSQEMPGRTLEDLDSKDTSRLVAHTYDVWRAIASSDLAGIHGYGPFDGQGKTTFSSWHRFLVEILDTAKHRLESVRPYPDVEVPKGWEDVFYSLTAFCPEERGLVHGDFGSNNVLADDENITGVVDWSEAMIGDPLYDVANTYFWRTWLPCMEQQAQYFDAHPLAVPNWRERILCYQLRIGLSELFESSLKRTDEAVVRTLGRCKQILRAIAENDWA